jgi:hypothetical protein
MVDMSCVAVCDGESPLPDEGGIPIFPKVWRPVADF